MTLNEMSEEYLRNVAVLERQMCELRERLDSLTPSEQYQAKRRICTLEQMISEGRATARYLAHYYERRVPVEQTTKRRRGRPRGSRTHTDLRRRYPKGVIPSYGTRAHSTRVSGLRAVLSGRYDAK